ncbi:tRNA uridine-5-carboxymethylaminomethyl(34) synthesis GTPase MnmE [Streptobacillus moniliformis]|uniref:tRNA modification GTPase MnmE n=1 Tax=Streptobacillus moniliformis (strain ATCC 14647 / DSM 12112 / NCTC 10651 / 9901) TaxID=519441 RepID=D1AWB7_STRM9|nr:tRNA uridine-5-carboxymethylaminomethyl(34) synthesis GTPase MnmE [Streptobacillus moniliformis]ACZ00593.1 tRNA modification GTPase TrmE [Streptobacillus moniliformis DSM 12112]AVL42995.1 tRNA uridine-5-carboxymethylaminomethyl(34) synthesis GTPase MnmE [Streptobacillus moniliformis]SQA14286.1 tRNA modification GTPase MnmE [Streptobacillus moniliformis]
MFFDTIAAISTARGESGIGIVRISGDRAFDILNEIFIPYTKNKDLGNYKLNYGYIYDEGKAVDEVLVSRMKGPRSYTTEDIVEINCHGGYYTTKKILEVVLKKGARMAEIGEFTKRAFMNGRIDLSQAEAVIDIIHGKTEKSVSLSLDQLKGSLRDQIKEFKEAFLDITAHVNVVMDYPEEGIDDPLPLELRKKLEEVYKKADTLISSYDKGKKIKEGIKTVIVGKPNVGKSTLLNTLLQEERAIVTSVPGTTRDVIEEIINIKGIPLVLVDTAGIRETDDIVENIGVKKSLEFIEMADLVLLVLDSSKEIEEEDIRVIEKILELEKQYIVLLNKIDLERKLDISKYNLNNIVEISAQNNINMDKMENEIYEFITDNEIDDSSERLILTNIRHKTALEKTKESIKNIFDTIDMGMPLDLISVDLKEGLDSLSEITGEITSEDVLDHIFAKFCVGK